MLLIRGPRGTALIVALLLSVGIGLWPAAAITRSPSSLREKTLLTFPASVGAVAVDRRGMVYLVVSSGVVALPPGGGPTKPVWQGAAADLAIDPSGNLFILDGGCNCVRELLGGQGHGTVVFSASDVPPNVVVVQFSGIAVDGSDTIYAVGGTEAMIFIKHPHVSPAAYTQALYAIDSFMAHSIAVDRVGNLFVADQYVGAIAELHAGTNRVDRLTTAATSFANHPGLAIDRAGDLFVAGDHTNSVIEIMAGTQQQHTVATGLNGPLYVAADDAHHLYVSDTGNGRFVKVDLTTGHSATIGWALARPSAVAEDASGTLYIADTGNSRVVTLPVHGDALMPLGHGLTSPSSVAVDARGRVVVADPGSQRVVAIDPTSGAQTDLAVTAQLRDPESVAADAHGNVYIADHNSDRVLKVAPNGITATPVSSGWIYPEQVAADAAGDVFVVNGANSALYEVPAGRDTGTTHTTGSGAASRVLLDGGQPIPLYMTADARGNVYFDDGHGHIVKRLPDGATQNTAAASFPQGHYVVDKAGNLFIVTANAIVEYPPATLHFRPSS